MHALTWQAALVLLISRCILGAYKGFNYGSTFSDGSAKAIADFTNEFNSAKNLAGTIYPFTSARLYTMVQAYTNSTPTSAIQAAIDTNTTLLLGIWASNGNDSVTNEIQALTQAISQYGTPFTDLITGISVGSEDLYRVSPTGVSNNAGQGATPDEIVHYISRVRSAIANTSASAAKVGHVDTWTAWVNNSNNGVITASDFLGIDAYPYFQSTMNNSIENSNNTFWDAYTQTVSYADGRSVWITETGWPVTGSTLNLAVPSVANAQTFFQQVGCSAFSSGVNTWWYTLQDNQPLISNPSFGIVGAGNPPPTTPLFNISLNC
jgi:glucan endo-1,3-beta-D-glucosidase